MLNRDDDGDDDDNNDDIDGDDNDNDDDDCDDDDNVHVSVSFERLFPCHCSHSKLITHVQRALVSPLPAIFLHL